MIIKAPRFHITALVHNGMQHTFTNRYRSSCSRNSLPCCHCYSHIVCTRPKSKVSVKREYFHTNVTSTIIFLTKVSYLTMVHIELWVSAGVFSLLKFVCIFASFFLVTEHVILKRTILLQRLLQQCSAQILVLREQFTFDAFGFHANTLRRGLASTYNQGA
jgi:hypothetical protein